MELFAHPFRLRANGDIYTVDQDSAEADAQQVAMICLTRSGERHCVPGFGLRDFAFGSLDVNEIIGVVNVYYPGVTLQNIKPKWLNDHELYVEIEF